MNTTIKLRVRKEIDRKSELEVKLKGASIMHLLSRSKKA